MSKRRKTPADIETTVDRIVDLILVGKTNRQISEALDLSPEAVRKYRKRPDYMTQLAERRRELRRSADLMIISATRQAVETLTGVLDRHSSGEYVKDADAIRAATVILDISFGGKLDADIEAPTLSGAMSAISIEDLERIVALDDARDGNRPGGIDA